MKKIKLLLLGFFLSVGTLQQTHALTLSQIQTEIRVRVKDTFTGRQRYSDTQLTALINEAQRDVINNTWVVTKSTSFATTLGTTYYTIPSDVLAIQRVTSSFLNIPEATLIKLDGDNGNSAWELSSGKYPQFYFQDYAQSNKIGIYPWPLDATSTTTVKIIYSSQVSDLASASDVPFNGESRYLSYDDLLIFYPAYRIYLIEGEQEKATIYRQEYESRLQVMVQAIGKKPNYNPGVSGASNGRK